MTIEERNSIVAVRLIVVVDIRAEVVSIRDVLGIIHLFLAPPETV